MIRLSLGDRFLSNLIGTQIWMALNSAEVSCWQGSGDSALHPSAGRRVPSAPANLDEPVIGEQHGHPSPEGHRSCQPSTRDTRVFISWV